MLWDDIRITLQAPGKSYESVRATIKNMVRYITLARISKAQTKQSRAKHCFYAMGLLPDTRNCRLGMRRKCRERFPRHRLQRKPLDSDPSMHHSTCVTHVP